MTRDVDFAVSVNDDSDAEEILFKLQQLNYVVESVIEHGRRAPGHRTTDPARRRGGRS